MTRLTHSHVHESTSPPVTGEPLWLLPNLLGLDAPVVAVLWQDLFARAAGVQLLASGRAALGLAVWAVYLGDRLLDTKGPEELGEATRHRFCRYHRTTMRVLLAAVIAAGTAAALFVRPVLLVEGIGIASAVAIYFGLVHFFRGPAVLPKEILVAFLFTAGTVLAPWSRTQDRTPLIAGSLAFFCVCILNTAAIEYSEWQRLRFGAEPGPHPFTRFIGKRLTAIAFALAGVYVAGSFITASPEVPAACALSTVLLLSAYEARGRMSNDGFRVLTDAALLSPLALAASRVL